MNVLAPMTQNLDMVNKAYVDKAIADLNISEYAKASELGSLASKNSLAFSELTDKPTTLTGYGITDALGKNETAASAAKFATARTIWGQSFDGTKNVTGLATFDSGIRISSGQSISFLDSAGAEHKISYDSGKKAFMFEGDFFATGEIAASNAGTSVTDIEQLVTRVESLEQSKSSNVEIKVSTLSTYNQQTLTSLAMTQLTGLTALIANSMLSGFYNKVIDKSGTYPKIWNYSATRSSNVISLFFAYGDGFNSKEGCRLDYNITTLSWNVSIDEL